MRSLSSIEIRSNATVVHTGFATWGLLQSAIAMPPAAAYGQYLHTDLCEMAAAYLFHIAQNHAFVDGNKRVAAVAASVFLQMNDLELTASPNAFEKLVLAIASSEKTKTDATSFFRKHTKEL